jgi:deoxyhypusine synthase
MGPISKFIENYYLHFNAASLKDAARAYKKHLADGNKMMVTLAGAMSSAEMGKILAEMIRQGKIHAISCTGANLEEDVFNLVAHDHYIRLPHWRNLTEEDDNVLLSKHMNRVTDTCIPEEEAIRRIEKSIIKRWEDATAQGKSHFPHEYFYQMLLNGDLKEHYQIDPKDSWLMAAAEKNLPMVVPGWEDSTLGNIFAGHCIEGKSVKTSATKNGIEYMMSLATWYREACGKTGIGFFQIGGGIAGDFPICVVPMIQQDLQQDVPKWNYFCQISDSTTSYGSYSGAEPTEKISWGKLDVGSPKFIVESDATIVAPLIFAYILEM